VQVSKYEFLKMMLFFSGTESELSATTILTTSSILTLVLENLFFSLDENELIVLYQRFKFGN